MMVGLRASQWEGKVVLLSPPQERKLIKDAGEEEV